MDSHIRSYLCEFVNMQSNSSPLSHQADPVPVGKASDRKNDGLLLLNDSNKVLKFFGRSRNVLETRLSSSVTAVFTIIETISGVCAQMKEITRRHLRNRINQDRVQSESESKFFG